MAPSRVLEDSHGRMRGPEPAAAPPRPAKGSDPWWRPRLLERLRGKPAESESGGAAEAGDLAEGG